MNLRDVDAVRRAVEQATEQQKALKRAVETFAASAVLRTASGEAIAAIAARDNALMSVTEALQTTFVTDIPGAHLLSEQSMKALAGLGLRDHLPRLADTFHQTLVGSVGENLAILSGNLQTLSQQVHDSLSVASNFGALTRLGLFPDSASVGSVVAGLMGSPSIEAIALTELAAKASFEYLPWETLGERLGISSRVRWGLQHSTLRLQRRYADLTQATSESEEPLDVVNDAPVSVLAHGQSLRVITTQASTDALVVGIRVEVVQAIFNIVEERLDDFNPKWAEMLRGARERAAKRGPDWPRQWATSYRQLFKNILHNAAPSDVVKSWDPTDLDSKGFPTRRAKVRWLCRGEADAQRRFLVEDIDSALGILRVLDEATHDEDVDIIEADFHWLSLRIEKAMHDILRLSRRG